MSTNVTRAIPLVALIALVAFWNETSATVVKSDLRTALAPTDAVIAFCVDAPKPSNALVGLATGDRNSGFTWRTIKSFAPATRHGTSAPPERAIERCIQHSLSEASTLYLAQVDQDISNKMITALMSDKKTSFAQVVSAFADMLKLVVPSPPDSSLYKFLVDFGDLNPGKSQDGFERAWQPPTVKLRHPLPASSSDPAQPAPPLSTGTSSSLLPTDLKGARYVDALALARFYQALADVQDFSGLHYDIELHFTGDVLDGTFVHPVEMRSDSVFEEGRAACINFSGKTEGIDPVQLINRLLTFSFTDADAVTKSWGLSPLHPMFGTPRNWQASVTNPPACYLSSTESAEFVSRISPTPAIKYAATVLHGFAKFPTDKPLFNSNAPVLLVGDVSTPQDLAPIEWSRRRYDKYIEQVRAAAALRSSSYPGLNKAQIELRQDYARSAHSEDQLFRQIRQEFALREIGWQQYLSNKIYGMQRDAITRYKESLPILYSTTDADQRVQEPTVIDLTSFLSLETQKYEDLMSIAALSVGGDDWLGNDLQYDKDLTVYGRVCELQPKLCASRQAAIQTHQRAAPELKLGTQTQTKFDNIVSLGALSTNTSIALSTASLSVPNGKCVAKSVDTPATNIPQEIQITVTNRSPSSVELTLAHVGSWISASWIASDGTDTDRVILAPNEGTNARIVFSPGKGYEDFNAIYLLEQGRPVSRVILDYTLVDDPLVRVFDLATPGFQSGQDTNWADYSLAVGNAPPLYSLAEACVWVSGDRDDCAHDKWATCSVSNADDQLVKALFSLQGHHEDPSARRFSSGHLWASYELRGEQPSLH